MPTATRGCCYLFYEVVQDQMREPIIQGFRGVVSLQTIYQRIIIINPVFIHNLFTYSTNQHYCWPAVLFRSDPGSLPGCFKLPEQTTYSGTPSIIGVPTHALHFTPEMNLNIIYKYQHKESEDHENQA